MPRILRQAWRDRLREDADFCEFRADFELVTRYRIYLVDETGLSEDAIQPGGTLCAGVQSDADGCRMCLRFRQSLLQTAAKEGTAWGVCDAGLREGAVALVSGELTVAYLVLGGCRDADLDGRAGRRARHLMARLLSGDRREEIVAHLEEWLAASREVPGEMFLSTLRLLRRWAQAWLSHGGSAVPESRRVIASAVRKALQIVRSRALEEEIRLSGVAGEIGVSPEHLSRLFHRHTGIPFHEYVARLRIEQVCEKLSAGKTGVTETAFECGFSSLSQFYRSFRKFTGTTPSHFLKHPSAGMDESVTPAL